MGFVKTDIKTIEKNVFRMIGDEWALVTAKKDGQVNTMTVSWGGMGVLWGKEVATIYIRPQRYTKEFIDADEDKIKTAGFEVEMVEDQPTFAQSSLVLVCRKLYEDKIKPELFKESWIDEKWYPDKDYHTMYIAEIVGAYVRE